jgi:large subunit ribosomal protein L30e
MSITNLKKAIKDKKLTIGTERTIKTLKNGKLKEVFMASNCPEEIKKQVRNYAKIAKVELTELEETNEELGTMCKKPFSINLCYY